MKLVFYNPHIHDFLGEPYQFRLLGRRSLKKYSYLVSEMLKIDGIINIYLDDSFSVLIPQALFYWVPSWIRKLIVRFEFNKWVKSSDLIGKVNIIKDEEITNKDVLFFFSHKITLGKFKLRAKNIERFTIKIVHLSHYFLGTSIKSANLHNIRNLWLAGDSDICENSYFKHHFPWYSKPMLIVPFAVADRFKYNVSFKDRLSKIVTTGTFHNLLEERPHFLYIDFMSFFKSDTYHPLRKLLFYNQEKLKDIIDCKNSLYHSYSGNVSARFFQKFNVRQKQYFAIDIVDLYNTYQFVVVGEELSGFPAIGAFEAIACGCVLIAQEEYYKGTDLIKDENYIAYDGTIEVLHSIVTNSNSKLLEKISINNRKNIFSSSKMYQKFTTELTKTIISV